MGLYSDNVIIMEKLVQLATKHMYIYTGYDTKNRMRPLCLGSICHEQLLRAIGMEIWAQVWMRVH